MVKITGNTYQARDLLRGCGFDFDKAGKFWFGDEAALDDLNRYKNPSMGHKWGKMIDGLKIEIING
jgi:hypothetical protein